MLEGRPHSYLYPTETVDIPSDIQLAEAAARLQNPDHSYLAYLTASIGDMSVYTQPIKGGPIVDGKPQTPSIAAKVSDILELGRELSNDGKIDSPKLDLIMVQALERRMKSSKTVEQLHDLCILGIIASVNKPDVLPLNLAADKILADDASIKKGRRETGEETAFRCAVLALRKFAFMPAIDPVRLKSGEVTRNDADAKNRAHLKAYAKSALSFLMDDETTAQKTKEEVLAAVALPEHIGLPQPQEPESKTTQPELPIQYVDWEPIPPSSIEELGITLPSNASRPSQGAAISGKERLHPRDEERFKLLAEVAIECCGDWEWGDEFGKVRIVRGRIKSGGEGTRRRLNRYRLGILPKTLEDGRIAEDAVAVGRYGNAALVWVAESGMADGEVIRTWPEVFQQKKPEIVAMGATWLKHSTRIKERILHELMQHRDEPDLLAKSPAQPN